MISPHYKEFINALVLNTKNVDKWKRTSSSNALSLDLKENTIMISFYSDSEYTCKKTFQVTVMDKNGDDVESISIRQSEPEYHKLSDYFQKIRTLTYDLSSETIVKLTRELS